MELVNHSRRLNKTQALFDLADVQVGGQHPWDIHIHNDQLLNRILRDGSLGLGEAIWTAGGTATISISSSSGCCAPISTGSAIAARAIC